MPGREQGQNALPKRTPAETAQTDFAGDDWDDLDAAWQSLQAEGWGDPGGQGGGNDAPEV